MILGIVPFLDNCVIIKPWNRTLLLLVDCDHLLVHDFIIIKNIYKKCVFIFVILFSFVRLIFINYYTKLIRCVCFKILNSIYFMYQYSSSDVFTIYIIIKLPSLYFHNWKREIGNGENVNTTRKYQSMLQKRYECIFFLGV